MRLTEFLDQLARGGLMDPDGEQYLGRGHLDFQAPLRCEEKCT
jgi:hypothetical protein